MNKDKAATNVANSTKKDMLSQMKNVRDIPTGASDANSQDPGVKPDDKLFEGILSLDNDVDNLFGQTSLKTVVRALTTLPEGAQVCAAD